MTTVNVSVELKDQDGLPHKNAIITSILTRVDVDTYGEYIIPEQQTWRTDENGVAVLQLWPNVLGTKGSRYHITGSSVNGNIILDVFATVPDDDVNLADIAEDITCFEGCYDSSSSGGATDIDAAIQAHEAKLNPHPQYARTSDIANAVLAHENKVDPHTQYIRKIEKGVTLATLEDGKVPDSQLPNSIVGNMHFAGNWNANTNTPLLESGTGIKGATYRVAVAGATSIDGQSAWLKDDLAIFDGAAWQRIESGAKVFSVNGKTGAVTLNAEEIAETANAKIMTNAERTKLAGIAEQATKNDTDANLRNRANHTGTQSADTITNGTNNKVFTEAEQSKLANIAANATANAADSYLLNRENHTGTQAIATIDGLPQLLSQKGDVKSAAGAENTLPALADSTGKQLKATSVKVESGNVLWGNHSKVIVFAGTSLVLQGELHSNCTIVCTNTSPITAFVGASNSPTSPIKQGFKCRLVQMRGASIAIQGLDDATLGATRYPVMTNAQYESAYLEKISDTECIVTFDGGDGIAEQVFYNNATPTPNTVGNIEAGKVFVNYTFTTLMNELFYPNGYLSAEYPWFATTDDDTDSFTEQDEVSKNALQADDDGFYLEFILGNKEAENTNDLVGFKFPQAWAGVKGIKRFGMFGWGWWYGSEAASLSDFVHTIEAITVNSESINYDVYTNADDDYYFSSDLIRIYFN